MADDTERDDTTPGAPQDGGKPDRPNPNIDMSRAQIDTAIAALGADSVLLFSAPFLVLLLGPRDGMALVGTLWAAKEIWRIVKT